MKIFDIDTKTKFEILQKCKSQMEKTFDSGINYMTWYKNPVDLEFPKHIIEVDLDDNNENIPYWISEISHNEYTKHIVCGLCNLIKTIIYTDYNQLFNGLYGDENNWIIDKTTTLDVAKFLEYDEYDGEIYWFSDNKLRYDYLCKLINKIK